MRPRGTARFALAIVLLLTLYQLSVPVFMAIGTRAGGWAVVAAVPVVGFGFAVIFTAVYDGPHALARLVVRSGGRAGHP
ncbi:MAG: hypothetical protein M3137_00130 [Actinomycetota bacterium]|nr:hypothetical protein [Actinomycetota bacterium]